MRCPWATVHGAPLRRACPPLLPCRRMGCLHDARRNGAQGAHLGGPACGVSKAAPTLLLHVPPPLQDAAQINREHERHAFACPTFAVRGCPRRLQDVLRPPPCLPIRNPLGTARPSPCAPRWPMLPPPPQSPTRQTALPRALCGSLHAVLPRRPWQRPEAAEPVGFDANQTE